MLQKTLSATLLEHDDHPPSHSVFGFWLYLMTDCVIFASWIFYGLVTSSVFVLRRRLPDAPRPYRTLGYPLVPLLFVATAAWLVVNTLVERRVESAVGLVLIAAGLPFYLYFRRRRGSEAAAA